MNLLQIAKERRSVRNFDGKPLTDEHKKMLAEYIETIENPYGIPVTFKLFDAKEAGLSSPVIKGESMYVSAKVPHVPNCEAAFGYSFEKLVIYAWSLGIGTTWIGGTFDRAKFEAATGLDENEIMPCASPLGYPAKRMSLKEIAMRTAIKADDRLPMNKIFFDSDFNDPLDITEDELAEICEIVRRAPSAVNKQPWRIVRDGNLWHFYEEHTKGYGAGPWDVQKVDVGIAICHFMSAAGGTLHIEDPGIATPADTEYMATVEL